MADCTDNEFKFKKGQQIWCLFENNFYKAKIKDVLNYTNGQQHYSIHYTKFDRKCGEIVTQDRILSVNKNNNTIVKNHNQANRLQRKIYLQHQRLKAEIIKQNEEISLFYRPPYLRVKCMSMEEVELLSKKHQQVPIDDSIEKNPTIIEADASIMSSASSNVSHVNSPTENNKQNEEIPLLYRPPYLRLECMSKEQTKLPPQKHQQSPIDYSINKNPTLIEADASIMSSSSSNVSHVNGPTENNKQNEEIPLLYRSPYLRVKCMSMEEAELLSKKHQQVPLDDSIEKNPTIIEADASIMSSASSNVSHVNGPTENNSISEQYPPGTIVWTKILYKIWWPGRVVNLEDTPEEFQDYVYCYKKNYKVIVSYDTDKTHDAITNLKQLMKYNCPDKIDLLKKGYLLYDKELKSGVNKTGICMANFIEDVKLAERATGGNENIFDNIKENSIKQVLNKLKHQQLLKALFTPKRIKKKKKSFGYRSTRSTTLM